MIKNYKNLTIRNSTAEFLIFTTQAGEDAIVWLTQKLMGKLFSVGVRTISEHLKTYLNPGDYNKIQLSGNSG